MISSHALAVLLLALAVAVVLLAGGLVHVQHRLSEAIAALADRVDALEGTDVR